MAECGNSEIPSIGMQYTQRRLQRSVTETRRYWIVRPQESTNMQISFQKRVHENTVFNLSHCLQASAANLTL